MGCFYDKKCIYMYTVLLVLYVITFLYLISVKVIIKKFYFIGNLSIV